VDPVPDPLLLRKSGGAGNRTLTTRPQRQSGAATNKCKIKASVKIGKYKCYNVKKTVYTKILENYLKNICLNTKNIKKK
jgi:hypothetical protein